MSIRIIQSSKSWIEGAAVLQLEKVAGLPGVVAVIGLPDLHPGKGFPIGAAFACDEFIYPFLVGNDIGCGISLWQIDLAGRKVKKERLVKYLEKLESQEVPLPDGESTPYDASIGTIGHGNHFAELQIVEKVHHAEQFERLGLDAKNVMMTIHSGSRGLGDATLRRYVDVHKDGGVLATSDDGARYLQEHARALAWAANNRLAIASKALACLGTTGFMVCDVCHNSIIKTEVAGKALWVHRKGAARSDQGVVMIPGSRGALSYLVKPTESQADNLWSIAHGAGRKYGRNAIKDRLKGEVDKRGLRQTKMGSLVICDDTDLLFEESPEAYKNIEIVIDDLVKAGLIEVIASFRPIITYKTFKTFKERS